MKVNFKSIELTDIDGVVIPNSVFYKTIANILYQQARTLDLVEIAFRINRAEEVELTPELLAEVKQLVNDPKMGVLAFARKAFNDYVDSLK